MGNIVSCCSLDENKKYLNDDEILERNMANFIPYLYFTRIYIYIYIYNIILIAFSNSEINEFKKRLKNNIQIVVLLQDGTKLPCNLQANFQEKTLCISY
ncbi:hypothetical protein PFTANZ_02848 [Plasmodium falciparum Tanzania (2000708)]|uniref:ISP1 C-terminal domain-containing protein n=1 Tax=Plasmodium falciparum Tanzania (2000708) TaxID=1036725 RepID=A0A024W7B4_PLAFA|nr:hypothetical protein PFTANZ_02848 [Plasmodium falciparum Tanzania (2000708)]